MKNALRLRLVVSLALVGVVCFSIPVYAADVIYEYNPGAVWDGYSLGTAAGTNQWGRFDVEFVPQAQTTVDEFCFNVTTKERIATTQFDLTVLFWSDDSPHVPFSTIFFDPFNWFDWLTGDSASGSWYNLLAGQATTSFSQTVTFTDASSTPNNDEVCFDILGDLDHSLGLPTGYPVIFRVEVPTADQNDCVRDIGDSGKCLVYHNYTAPYSSQSMGFTFERPPSADLMRNAMFSGRITGWSAVPAVVDPVLGATIVDWTQVAQYGVSSQSSGFDASGAVDFCSSYFASTWTQDLCIGVGFLFIPSQDSIKVFMNNAREVQNRVPWVYLEEIKDAWDNASSSSTDFPEITAPIEIMGSSTSMVLISSASFTRWVDATTLGVLRGFTTVGIYFGLMWYLWRRARYVFKTL